MKRPSRSMINGTAVTLAAIAGLLLLLFMLQNCPGGNSGETTGNQPVTSAIVTDSTTTQSTDKTSKPAKPRKKARETPARVIPERSPLDEEIPR